jgi:hypothetical protein
MTKRLEDRIRVVLMRFLDDKGPDPMSVRQAADALGALPVVSDMGGCFLLRPNGSIISIAWDKPADWRPEDDPRVRNLVLFAASQKYPELRELAPQRPSGAPDCPFCGGTGKHPMSAKRGLENVGCYCGGLGWIPANDPAVSGSPKRG